MLQFGMSTISLKYTNSHAIFHSVSPTVSIFEIVGGIESIINVGETAH